MSILPIKPEGQDWATSIPAADPYSHLAKAFDIFAQRISVEVIPMLKESTMTIPRTEKLVKQLQQNHITFTEVSLNGSCSADARGQADSPPRPPCRMLVVPLAQVATTLDGLVEDFHNNCSPPYNIRQMKPDAIRANFDRSGQSVAGMCKLLYRQLQHCRFGEQRELLLLVKDIADEFDMKATDSLAKLGLQYYETNKLLLVLEQKFDVCQKAGQKKDRRRRKDKEPDAIEKALMECLRTIIPLRDKIVNPKKVTKFNRLIGKACGEFIEVSEDADGVINDPRVLEGELDALVDEVADAFAAGRKKREETVPTEREKGRRLEHLIDACATLQKIGRWIREVDLQSKEISSSRRLEVINQFETLTDLAMGRDAKLRDKF